jgi:dGTPase
MAEAVELFHDFMFQNVYLNPTAKSEESKVSNIISGIWEYYVNRRRSSRRSSPSSPTPRACPGRCATTSPAMTDKFAITKYSEIFIPAAWAVY